MKHTSYICRDCGITASPTSFVDPVDLSPTPYQEEKITDHTSPSALRIDYYHSIFLDPAQYNDLGASTFEHGAFEIEKYPSGYTRINRLWPSGSIIGITYYNRVPLCFGETVKQVLLTNPSSIHWFPVASPMVSNMRCNSCGSLLFE